MTDGRLEAILERAGEEELWRDTENVTRLLSTGSPEGTGDRLTPAFLTLDLAGKSVADFGCNIGYYSFLSRQLGAGPITGYDNLPRMVEVAEHFAGRFSVSGVSFRQADFYEMPMAPVADVVLAIDIVGNRKVEDGTALSLMERFFAFSGRELVATLRPVFGLGRNLEMNEAQAQERYPGFVREGRLHFLECIQERHPEFRAQVISSNIPSGEFDKDMVRFVRVAS